NLTAADGFYNVSVGMYDNSSNYNISYQNNSVVKDTTSPTITITYPTNGQVFSTVTITVTGSALDNMGLSKVEVKVNSGSWKTATGTTSWSKSVTLSSGSNTIYARATDTSGNTNETSVTVTLFYTGSVIYVPDDYSTIQAAVNAASEGDTIIMRDGTYIENVDIDRRLTIKSENGADFTLVQAQDSDDNLFYVRADYVNLSGFTLTGATGVIRAGIYLDESNYCNISSNNVSSNYYGTYLYSSGSNTISNNTVSDNWRGIDLSYSSSNNTISNNNVSNNVGGIRLYNSSNNNISSNTINSNNDRGVLLYYSSNNNISSNTINSNNDRGVLLYYSSNNNISSNTINSNNNYGLYLWSSSNNTIYNNYFNNTNNAYDDENNIWNISKTEGTNIIDGPYLGGNYWDDYTGDDIDGDGLGDTPYDISGSTNKDYLPLVSVGVAEVTIQYDLVKKPGSTGKNWISIPLETDITTASQLMAAIGSNCDAVNRWNPVTQKPEGWISLLGGMGTNFDIVPGEAYEISVTANTTFSLTGTPATIGQIDLVKKPGSTGKNWIGLPYDTTLTTASTVMSSIGSNCDAVNRWNPVTQKPEGWISLMGGMGKNFNIVTGGGYEISITGNMAWTPI
ncbi:MAG: NosD domain-containing protein, partial [Methanocellales archaeon]|nr:NosD domain-containing protein [Methanocellales archaeon]